MVMTAEQIKEYLEQRLKNIRYNLKYAETQEQKTHYGAQELEISDILNSIR